MKQARLKIILINPPADIKDIYGKYSLLASLQPPIGLCSLASYLIKNGYEVKILDANVLHLSTVDIVRYLKNQSAQLVGIYVNTPSCHVVAKLVEEIKKANVVQSIVAGGPHITFLAESSLEQIPFDYCVIGEGEKTLLELANSIESNSKNLSNVDGLVFKTSDNRIIVNKPRGRISDLDTLPFPAIHLLPPISKYKPYLLHYKKLPFMPIITSRGCPHQCIFCNTPFGKSVSLHSAEYVVDYVEFLTKQFGVKEVFFCDDTFSINENRIYDICRLLKRKRIAISWYANMHANIKDKGIFKEMKKSGCWLVAIGVESGDERILRLIKKNVSLNQVTKTCKLALQSGLMLKTFFILGNPGETLETIEKTINFALSLKSHYPVFSLMTPYPGTELWNKAETYGVFSRSHFDKLLISSSTPIFVPFGLDKEILLKKQKEAYRRLYLNPGMIIRQLLSINSIEDVKKLLMAFYSFINIQGSK